jgi:hypothetical protein
LAEGLLEHPASALHESSVQAFPSLQVNAPLPVQTPFWHVSVWVQASLSLHVTPVSLTCVHAPPLSQPSVVHGLSSLQSTPDVPLHFPPAHWSPLEHELPSSQVVPSGMLPWVHPFNGWQLSFVHGFRSSQSSALPAEQAPVLQTSVPLHTSLSAHVVPSGCEPSGGQVGDEPVQDSFASQSPVGGRQTVPALPDGCAQVPLPLH